MSIFNKFSIKFKVFLIAAFSIFYMLLFTFSNNYFSSKVQETFRGMEKNELHTKNLIQDIINNISKINKLVIVASISEEVTPKTIEMTASYNAIITKNISALKTIAKNKKKKKLKEYMNLIEKRYTAFYSIAANLHTTFKEDFDDGIDEIIGLDAISTKMEKELSQLLKFSHKNFNNKLRGIDKLMDFSHQFTIVVSIVAITLFIIFSYLFTSSIISSINKFRIGLSDFFMFLNKEKTSTTLLNESYDDEIGDMAKVVNKNIKNIELMIKEDNKIIDDVTNVVNHICNGYLDKRVTTTSSNPTLNKLITVLNQMIESLHQMIEHSLETLSHYEKQDFRGTTSMKCSGELCNLMNGIDALGSAISSMLVQNKKDGLILQNSSNILLKDIEILNTNANQSATSLEETSTSIEEIATNIENNTNNVIKMAQFANKVTTSVNAGQELANQTTQAMEEMSTEVSAINDAISVIDQISFQTNILSLNAAVEAATAGESGKGFAVVAQEVRNLASRSSDAANEIKSLVEKAIVKSNSGKTITDQMITGYNTLNENIVNTLDLIKDVEVASKEQQKGITQINNTIGSLENQTQENAAVASKTNTIAKQTASIANNLVEEANKKEFNGKDTIDI